MPKHLYFVKGALFSTYVSASAAFTSQVDYTSILPYMYFLAGFITVYIFTYFLSELTPEEHIDRLLHNPYNITLLIGLSVSVLFVLFGLYDVETVIVSVSEESLLDVFSINNMLVKFNIFLLYSFFFYMGIYGLVSILYGVFGERNAVPSRG